MGCSTIPTMSQQRPYRRRSVRWIALFPALLTLLHQLLLPATAANAESVSPDTTAARKQIYIDKVLGDIGNATVIYEPCTCDGRRRRRNVLQSNEIAAGTYQLPGRSALPLFPFTGRNLPVGTVPNIMCEITCPDKTTGDFELAQLVRVLYLTTNVTLQQEILSAITTSINDGQLRLWLEPNEKHNVYWSENHIIMWLSSDYLIQQKLNKTDLDGSRVEKLVLHFLRTKLQYGFYEFFSPTYGPFTIAPLLNLRDFASNEYIRSLAEEVITKLLEQRMLIINNQGSYFPAAGRAFARTYVTRPFLGIVWMLTGKGNALTEGAWRSDYIGAFLATTAMDFEPIASTWTPILDTQLQLGHDIREHKQIHAELDFVDRVMFQWSAGGFFHPEVVKDTKQVIDDYNLAGHTEWKSFGFLLNLSKSLLFLLSQIIVGLAKGTNIAGATVNIYKNNDVVLTSIEKFNVGYLAGESWPWVATAGDIAVWTQAGITGDNFLEDVATSNTHLPEVKQAGNVALISYRPSSDIVYANKFSSLTGQTLDTQVSLRFPLDRFDEVAMDGKWIMGRRGDSYIAVWRDGHNDQNTCATNNTNCDAHYFSNPTKSLREQVWAVVVGNNESHGSFLSFSDVIRAGEVTEKKELWLRGVVYKTSVNVDNKIITSLLD